MSEHPSTSSAPYPAEYCQRLVGLTSDAIVCADPEGRIVFANAAAEAAFGYDGGGLRGVPLSAILPDGTTPGEMEPVAGGDAAGARRRILARRRDGSEFPAEASLLRSEVGGVELTAVVVHDASETERLVADAHRARDQARAAENRARFLLAAVEALGSTLDSDETLAALGSAPVPLLAEWTVVYMREAEEGLRRVDVFHPDPARRASLSELLREVPPDSGNDSLREALKGGDPVRLGERGDIDWGRIAADGREEELRTEIAGGHGLLVPILLRGEAVGLLGLFRGPEYLAEDLELARDLAYQAALALENARLHREMHEAVSLRDEIIGVVSHDLRNPISVIKMTLSLLREVEFDEEERARKLAIVERAAESMNRLVHDLLDVSSLESGRFPLDQVSWEADVLVDRAYQSLAPLAEGRRVALEREVERPLPPVVADVERIMQVFSNLVGNALKYSDPGDTVRIRAERLDESVRFCVADEGPGIAEDDVPHVFDRFWQVRHNRRGGAGLGLAIVKGIVEAHGGEVGVESTLGEGSEFWFTLPTDRRRS